MADSERDILNALAEHAPEIPHKLAKLTPEQATQDQHIARFIQKAAEKAGVHLDPLQKRHAIDNFKRLHTDFAANVGPSANSLANISLLGVISVYQAGGIRPIIQIDHGNRFDAPDQNPLDGGSQGGMPIDAEKTMVYLYADPRGLEGYTLRIQVENAPLGEGEQIWLEKHGYLAAENPQPEPTDNPEADAESPDDETSNSNIPRPRPQ